MNIDLFTRLTINAVRSIQPTIPEDQEEALKVTFSELGMDLLDMVEFELELVGLIEEETEKSQFGLWFSYKESMTILEFIQANYKHVSNHKN